MFPFKLKLPLEEPINIMNSITVIKPNTTITNTHYNWNHYCYKNPLKIKPLVLNTSNKMKTIYNFLHMLKLKPLWLVIIDPLKINPPLLLIPIQMKATISGAYPSQCHFLGTHPNQIRYFRDPTKLNPLLQGTQYK